MVEVKIDSNQCIVCTCSCTTFHHKLVLCRHVFAILNRPPTSFDVFPECQKDYAVWYGDEQQPTFNAHVDKRTKLLEHFGGMIYEGTLDDNIKIDSSELMKYDDDLFGDTFDNNPRRASQWTPSGGWRPSDTVPCTAPAPERPMGSTMGKKFHTRLFEGSAYMQLRKLFEHICNLAITPAQVAELRSVLDCCHRRMLVTAVERENTNDNTNDNGREVMNDVEEECTRKTTLHGLQSYSAICKSRTRKRLRPVSSPPKR